MIGSAGVRIINRGITTFVARTNSAAPPPIGGS
jgi:hypothetical protein